MTDVSRVLSAIEQGDPSASEQLLPLVYDELRKLAIQKMAREKPGQTLQATALVHEAYLRLVNSEEAPQWNSRAHFFGVAAEAMRRILVDNARKKRALRHGGNRVRIDLDGVEPASAPPENDLIALNEALESLQEEDGLKTQIVKLRFFAGLTVRQTAQALGISASTVDNHWAYARAWLRLQIADNSGLARK